MVRYKYQTVTLTKKIYLPGKYTRAQMNQRRVVGIVVIAMIIGAVVGCLTPIKIDCDKCWVDG